MLLLAPVSLFGRELDFRGQKVTVEGLNIGREGRTGSCGCARVEADGKRRISRDHERRSIFIL